MMAADKYFLSSEVMDMSLLFDGFSGRFIVPEFEVYAISVDL